MQLTLVAYLLPYLFTRWSDLRAFGAPRNHFSLADEYVIIGLRKEFDSPERIKKHKSKPHPQWLLAGEQNQGHWKRNSSSDLAEVAKEEKERNLGVVVVRYLRYRNPNTFLLDSWFYDTGCVLDHGILAYLTPPYTHNTLVCRSGETETLLDTTVPHDHPESDKWLNAMNVEMQSMKDNEVWVLVELPPNGKTVGSKWLFKKKTDMDGAVHTYKARLVAKGYTQTPRIDYEETFSPVADIRAIKVLIA
ncbi:putative retrotransposon ty1-copia subclass protein [Tanacetum coccineum]|uniref:Retrotransposon ty1-copia subclass protein n=1 Tax=Tanacetum coccineum TaxID=301880 RepID=A0ABQ5DKB9_9ASTR